jgi:ferredoxin
MRIVVDLNRCQGYAQCVPLASAVLKLSGEEDLMYDPNRRERILEPSGHSRPLSLP